MGLSFEFSPVWWILLFFVYAPYIFLFWQRKSYKKAKEVKIQLFIACTVLLLAFVIEFIAISNNLWNYTPMNWPISLWVAYFGAGLLGYQLVKKLEELFR